MNQSSCQDFNRHAQFKMNMCQNCFQQLGIPQQRNLCYQCYKEFNSEKKYDEKIIISQLNELDLGKDEQMPSHTQKENQMDIEDENSLQYQPTEIKRCYKCNRKVGYLGFICRCNHYFCKAHRLPEEHQCQHNFQFTGKERSNLMY